ncbi:hypothetical protein [Okeania sp. SIO3I5]|uniref:hypothetical protein n=1 Tax=Okeania sp. SIO3I5 TaxID=2607805 RepID=UPI0025DDFE6C|nr:hypothetical protein [Okeania sp. SIO3I5]
MSCQQGKIIKKSGYQKYICRLKEVGRKDRRHSNFWVGIYGELWVIAAKYLVDLVQGMMNLSRLEKALLSKGIKSHVYLIRLSICTFKHLQFI